MEDLDNQKIKGKAGGWSKWGGRSFGLLDAMNERFNGKLFYCQICGDEEPLMMSFAIERPNVGYIKVCGSCYFDEVHNICHKKVFDNLDLFKGLFEEF